MEKCIGCACELNRGIAQRRKLYSPSTSHVLPVLTALFREQYSTEDVDKILPPVNSERCKDDIYL